MSVDAISDGDVVELSVPARADYVATVRLAAAALSAACDLTVDDIEDLRLAVDEACALMLPLAAPDSALDTRFEPTPGCLGVQVSVLAAGETSIDRSGLGWTVLDALSSSVETSDDDGRLQIAITKRRAPEDQ
jgi:serine/threonine-protein kinase RsbW